MRRAARTLLPLAAALALLGGCAKSKGTVQPNAEPETWVFVQGAIDVVNHRVRLHWFGSDPDGDVVAFELRFRPRTPGAPIDSSWVRVASSGPNGYDSLFTVPTPTGLDSVVFEVRAVDDDGAIDPTPAVQGFTLSNDAATVVVRSGPTANDTTFASVTLDLAVNDPDGDATRATIRAWLNDGSTGTDVIGQGAYTVPSARFRLPGGGWYAGRCTLNLQAVDDGGREGPVTQVVWPVRAPWTNLDPSVRKVLVIDDAPSGSPGNFGLDTLYANTLARNAAPGSYSIIRLQFSTPFRSARDVAQTLRLFDAVVWYRGDTGTYTGFGSPGPGVGLLQAHQDTIAAWVEGGGRFFLECMNPIEDPQGQDGFSRGPLRREFLDRWAASDSFRTFFRGLDLSVAWGSSNGGFYRSSKFGIGLRTPVLLQTIGIRAFAVRDTNDVVFWARPGALNPANAEDFAVGTSRRVGGGRVMLMTYPVRFNNPTFSSTAEVLRRMLYDPAQGVLAAP